MKRTTNLSYQFVEYVPDELKDGILYISVQFATAVHRCCCGCGNEVVTPLSPNDWKLTFDGESVSLYPSIGNWSFACQSHYWIVNNRIRWASRWSRQKINVGRARDSLAKVSYFETGNLPISGDVPINVIRPVKGKPKNSIWRRLKKRLFPRVV